MLEPNDVVLLGLCVAETIMTRDVLGLPETEMESRMGVYHRYALPILLPLWSPERIWFITLCIP